MKGKNAVDWIICKSIKQQKFYEDLLSGVYKHFASISCYCNNANVHLVQFTSDKFNLNTGNTKCSLILNQFRTRMTHLSGAVNFVSPDLGSLHCPAVIPQAEDRLRPAIGCQNRSTGFFWRLNHSRWV